MKIAVDFDGTCVDHRFPDVGPDAPDAMAMLRDLVAAGHEIYLWTMRSGEYLPPAVKWFIDRQIPLSGINSNPGQSSWTQSPKCFADLYIDDASFGCPLKEVPGFKRLAVDWSEVSRELLELKSHKEMPIYRETRREDRLV